MDAILPCLACCVTKARPGTHIYTSDATRPRMILTIPPLRAENRTQPFSPLHTVRRSRVCTLRFYTPPCVHADHSIVGMMSAELDLFALLRTVQRLLGAPLMPAPLGADVDHSILDAEHRIRNFSFIPLFTTAHHPSRPYLLLRVPTIPSLACSAQNSGILFHSTLHHACSVPTWCLRFLYMPTMPPLGMLDTELCLFVFFDTVKRPRRAPLVSTHLLVWMTIMIPSFAHSAPNPVLFLPYISHSQDGCSMHPWCPHVLLSMPITPSSKFSGLHDSSSTYRSPALGNLSVQNIGKWTLGRRALKRRAVG